MCPGAVGAVWRGNEGTGGTIFSGILRDSPVSFLCMVKIVVMRTETFLSLHGLSAVACLNDGQTDRQTVLCMEVSHFFIFLKCFLQFDFNFERNMLFLQAPLLR